MWQTIVEHRATIIVVASCIFSAAVSSLDPPEVGEKGFYRWFYKFGNAVAFNMSASRTIRLPVGTSTVVDTKE